MYILASTLLILFTPPIFAQNFSIPKGWTNTDVPLSRAQRSKLAQALLDTVGPLYDQSTGLIEDLDYGQNANLLSATANFDSITLGQVYSRLLTDRFKIASERLIPTIRSDIHITGSSLMWGLTAIYAYRAYKDESFINAASAMWNEVTPFLITKDHANSGSHPLKTFRIPAQCNGMSTVGGVFSRNGTQDSMISASTNGAFIALSTYLYGITKNETFLNTAELSRQFTQSQFYDNQTGIIRSTLNLTSCDIDGSHPSTQDTALYLEGISLLANLTDNSALGSFADQLAANAMMTSNWTAQGSGLINEEVPAANITTNSHKMAIKGQLIRALREHWSRSPDGSDIAKLTRSFINIQYNSLLSSATTKGSNIYSPRWDGPPPSTLLSWGQLAAADLMNSVIGLDANPSPIPLPMVSSSGTLPTDVSTRHLNIGLIIGPTVGGIVLIAGIVATFVAFRRLRRRGGAVVSSDSESSQHELVDITSEQYTVAPYPPTAIPSEGRDHLSSRIHQKTDRPGDLAGSRSPPPPNSRLLPRDNADSTHESINELVFRLNHAIAQLPPTSDDSGSTSNPPDYQSLV